MLGVDPAADAVVSHHVLHGVTAALRDGRVLVITESIVGKVDLHRVYITNPAQIKRQPLARRIALGTPPGPDLLVDGLVGAFSLDLAGGPGLFAVGQEQPFVVTPGILLLLLHTAGPVAVALVAPELSLAVVACQPEADTALKDVINADAHGGDAPEITVPILHGGAVACPWQKAARLIGEGVVPGKREGAQGVLADVDAVSIGVKLRAGRAVLEIIAPVVLVRPGALYISPVGDVVQGHGPMLPAKTC